MRIALGVILALLVASSAMAQQASAPTRPVSFAKIAAKIPMGTPWARLQQTKGVFGCSDEQVVTWNSENSSSIATGPFDRIFREELGQAGLMVSGDPTNLFEEDQKTSDLQVGALVTGIDAKFCATQTYWEFVGKSDHFRIKGSAAMKIEWQVYSTSQARVLARIPTDARYETDTPIDAGNVVILQRAFAANVQALAASDQFRAILTEPASGAAASGPAMGPLGVAFVTAFAPMPLDQAAKGVVSIFAGGAMGSGVLISRDGYILTNHHVAGEAGRVRVRWSDGSDSVGEVIRSDRRRDVALIKTTAKAAPLAIRPAPLRLGETVYAIGTPREREFAGTLTRGVVSTVNRVIEGQGYIQSDAAITHGNSGGPLLDEKGWIVGLSQSTYEPDGVSQNINFFVPIEDALRALNLKPAP